MVEVTTSMSVDITNIRLMHLASGLSLSSPVQWTKRGVTVQGNCAIPSAIQVKARKMAPPKINVEDGKSGCGGAHNIAGCEDCCFGPKPRQKICQYGTTGPITEQIRRENWVWNGQSKVNLLEVSRECESQEDQCVLED